MSSEEKKSLLEAWDNHIHWIACQQKNLRFSSVAEADFCDTFRKGILAHKGLTKKEKLEVCAYTKL